MTSHVTLKEHGEAYVAISDSDASSIQDELRGKLDLDPSSRRGKYLVKAGSHVGFVELPGEIRVAIEPKIPIDTILYLLSLVYDPSKEFFKAPSQTYSTIEGLFEFVVSIFVSHVEDLISRGIIRGYRSRTDDLIAIRGRLLIAETIHKRPALRDRHWCSYSRFTGDIAENVILRSTIQVLRAHSFRENALHGRLWRAFRALTGVTIEDDPRSKFEQLEFHRLNEHYRPALSLARLLLDHITFTGSTGDQAFLSFLVDMDWLFEKVVGEFLRRGAGRAGIWVQEQKHHRLDRAGVIRVQPDYILYRGSEPILVLDAKYKIDPHQADVYQILAYCHALRIQEAALVHPVSEYAPAPQLTILGTGNVRVHYLSVDLSGGPAEIDLAGEQLAASALGLARDVAGEVAYVA